MALVLTAIHVGIWVVFLTNIWYLRQGAAPTTAPENDAPNDPTPMLSVLIPARNEAANLRRLLPSLLAQCYPRFEVIIYDDGSDDGTWDVIQEHAAEGGPLRPLRGDGPPPGWVGKVHALFQATRAATGDVYLFLDADARLEDEGALARLAGQFRALPAPALMTGLTRLRGAGQLLVSLVPNAILIGLPWALVRRVRAPSLGALNGQCWMIGAAPYHRYEPHEHLPDEVLEDVQIGRYLKRQGLTPVLRDVQQEVSIFMYPSFAAAWRGFRKNAYLIMGGTPLAAALFVPFFAAVFVLAPLAAPGLLLSVYLLKLGTDRLSGFPLWVSLLAPVSFVLAVALQCDSAISHWRGRVDWKGRQVSSV